MTIDIRNKKFDLIEFIKNIEDSSLLDKIERTIIKLNEDAQPLTDIEKAVKPIRTNVTLDQIDQEQSYTPFNYKEFKALADALELEEPIEDLLEMLTK